MRIAVFKMLRTSHPFETIKDESWEKHMADDYVRISEYIDVEFPRLKSEEVVQKQLDALDTMEKEVRTKFQAALNTIEQQRQELRAITVKA